MACSLPIEIINSIKSFFDTNDLKSCVLVSKSWYSTCINDLYFDPFLDFINIFRFFKTICPAKNAPKIAHERANLLAAIIRHLCLDKLIESQCIRHIPVAQLLYSVKDNLEKFRAPPLFLPDSFFDALSKCIKLNYLDLSLVQNQFTYEMLLGTISQFPELKILFLPRNFSNDQLENRGNFQTITDQSKSWSSCLQTIEVWCDSTPNSLNDDFFFIYLSDVPKTLSKMQIHYCQKINANAIDYTLNKIGFQLTHLAIRVHDLSLVPQRKLDSTLRLCPSLVHFLIAEDFVTENLFENLPLYHKLRCFTLQRSFEGKVTITPAIILRTIKKGRLLDLRRFNYTNDYNDEFNKEESKSDLQDLSDMMNALDAQSPSYEPCGIKKYDSSDFFYPPTMSRYSGPAWF